MKIIFNANVGKFLAIVFAVGIHCMFAAGAYYLGLFFAYLILDQIGGWPAQAIAVGYAIAVFLGSSWAFLYGEYAKQDVKAYASVYGGWGVFSLRVLLGFIALNEIGSLGFRLTQVPDPSKRLWFGVGGIALLGIAFMLGKVIHAMANRPVQVQVSRMIDAVGRSYVDDVTKNANKLTAADKLRVLQGDISPLNEVRDIREQERLEAERARLALQEEKAMRKRQEREDKEAQKRTQREEEARNSALSNTLSTKFLSPGENEDGGGNSPFNRSRRA